MEDLLDQICRKLDTLLAQNAAQSAAEPEVFSIGPTLHFSHVSCVFRISKG